MFSKMLRSLNARGAMHAACFAALAASCIRAAPPPPTTYKVGITTRIFEAPEPYSWRGCRRTAY